MTEEFDKVVAALPELRLSAATRERHLAGFAAMMPLSEQSRSRRRRIAVLAVVGFLTLAAGTGVAASLGAFDAPVPNHNTAHCYTTPDLSRADNHNDFGVVVSPGDPDVVRDAAAQAIEICSSQWAIGRFTTAAPTFQASASGPATHPIPPLTACVLDNGEVGVFPGSRQICISLGLANAIM